MQGPASPATLLALLALLASALALSAASGRVRSLFLDAVCGGSVTGLVPGGRLEAIRLSAHNTSALGALLPCAVGVPGAFFAGRALHVRVAAFAVSSCSAARNWRRVAVARSGAEAVGVLTDCDTALSLILPPPAADAQVTVSVSASTNAPTRLELVLTPAEKVPARGVNCTRPGYRLCPRKEYPRDGFCVHQDLFCDGHVNCLPDAGRDDETGCPGAPPSWSPWSAWSPCPRDNASACAGTFSQTRARHCNTSRAGAQCPGAARESRPCPVPPACDVPWWRWPLIVVCGVLALPMLPVAIIFLSRRRLHPQGSARRVRGTAAAVPAQSGLERRCQADDAEATTAVPSAPAPPPAYDAVMTNKGLYGVEADLARPPPYAS